MYKFIFYKGDKTVGEINADSIEQAQEKLGLNSGDFDYCDDNLPVEDIKRKPRADKGQPRVTKKDTNVTNNVVNKVSQKVGNKRDKKRQYFILSDNELITKEGVNRSDALDILSKQPVECWDMVTRKPTENSIRIIMGHEITFSRKIQFHA